MEPCRSVNEGGSHSGSSQFDVHAIRKDQGGRHREVQRQVRILVDSTQRNAQLFENLGATDEVQRGGAGLPDAHDETTQVL